MTTPEMLDERYGRTRPAMPRWVVVAVIVVAAVGFGAVGWSIFAANIDAVDADTTGFEVVDEHSVAVSFQFSGPVGRSIACALEAQDREHGVVGWKVVEYPASDLPARAFREVLATTGDATTGLVNSCWVT
ncbi:DUF4307 domain-containing protein [Microbacterium thalassium]|uniref:DUF4307 domain-containing protein n=1 Tax=Microbacterium thalassium TaxID=362649 RepID=A0A7X0FSN8_9MICO|nr:DUF4307 domain-containing protein [Microbacterium thalassium]MBB6392392.1 hypothetical protein [Microbacterium thalassium]GLK25075.1 hypothetical protein GCM10017607_23930 [Microbacterium thalassium]